MAPFSETLFALKQTLSSLVTSLMVGVSLTTSLLVGCLPSGLLTWSVAMLLMLGDELLLLLLLTLRSWTIPVSSDGGQTAAEPASSSASKLARDSLYFDRAGNLQ